MKITLCAIMRNEETSLPVMLDSLKDHVDEIVLLDTGSTDNTVEVAKRYTDKVFFREWDDSFANAINACMDHATGDWILKMDCDEVMTPESARSLRGACECVDADVDLILVPLEMCEDNGAVFQRFVAERLIRRSSGAKFVGAMHNWVDVPVSATKRVAIPQLCIKHNRVHRADDARAERSNQRVAMAEKIFTPLIEADPKDRRSLFYLAGTYADAGRCAEAVPWYEKYLEVSDWPEERYQASLVFAHCLKAMGERDRAKDVLSTAIHENWRRAEAQLELGIMAQEEGDHEQAIVYFREASLKPPPLDPMFVEVQSHTWKPHAALFESYRTLGRIEEALQAGERAIENGMPNVGIVRKLQKSHEKYGDRHIAVLVDRGQMNFVDPLIAQWRENGKVVTVHTAAQEAYNANADIIWCEWAGPEFVKLTAMEKRARIVVRVHGYELHAGTLEQATWDAVDDVICVARYLAEAVAEVPGLADTTNLYVVPGGVECDKFSIADGKSGNKVAMLGWVNTRKNIPLALQILGKAKGKELHIGGEWQDKELLEYTQHMIREMNLQDRVFVYNRVDDANEFFADKDFILSTGVRETFHYALAEGMAAGLKPVIHAWRSSRDFYDGKWIFRSVDEAVAMLKDAGDPQEYRDYALANLDVSRNKKRMQRVIDRPAIGICGQASNASASEYKIAAAAAQIGFRVDSDVPQLALLTGHTGHIEKWMDGIPKILWHKECVSGDDEHARLARERIAPVVPLVDLVISLNPNSEQVYLDMGAKRVEYVSCATAWQPFTWRSGAPKEFDVGFSGVVTERRKPILEELGKHFSLHVFENYDHAQVSEFFNRCKVVLNLHCTDELNVEQRIGEAMACGACIVSEPLPEGHGIPDGLMIQAADLKSAIRSALKQDEMRGRMGADAHRWIWAHQRLDQQLERIVELVGY